MGSFDYNFELPFNMDLKLKGAEEYKMLGFNFGFSRRNTGPPRTGLLFYARSNLTDSIGVLSTSYAQVDPAIRDLFYSAVDTPYDVATCYANALASPLLNIGTMIGKDGVVLLYADGTAQTILDRALKYCGYTTLTDQAMLPGYVGYFNLTDIQYRQFDYDASWIGYLTGTDAWMACVGSAPYLITVDGVTTNPTASSGEIELFRGLSNTPHLVEIRCTSAAAITNNKIPASGTVIRLLGRGVNYIGTPAMLSDPETLCLTTNAAIPVMNELLAPHWDNYDGDNNGTHGSLIVTARGSELWAYTASSAVRLSTDGQTASKVNLSAVGDTRRRWAKIADIDESTYHEYTLWDEDQVARPALAVMIGGSNASMIQTTSRDSVRQFGDSITFNGSATPGAVDTWIYGPALGYIASKSGVSGQTTAGLTATFAAVFATIETPDLTVLAIGRNDLGLSTEDFKTNYLACINSLLYNGCEKIICRGITPNPTSLAAITNRNIEISEVVATLNDPMVGFVDTSEWTGIDAPDNTHPSEVGFVTLSAYEVIAYATGDEETVSILDKSGNKILDKSENSIGARA